MNSKIKKNYVYNLIYRIVMIASPLITSPYISRVLGAEKIGEYSFMYSIAHIFLIFAMLGVSDYGNREIAKVKDDEEKKNVIFSEIFYFQIILGIIMTLSYFVYVFAYSEYKILGYTQLLLVVSTVFDVTWLMFGLEQFLVTTIRSVIIKILSVVCIIVFVNSPSDLNIYAIIMSSSILISQISLWPLLHKYVKFKKVKVTGITRHIKPNLILFLPVIANNLLAYFDKIMIGSMCSKEELGCYDNAEKLLSIPNSFITALGTVMLPRVSNAYARGETKKIEEYTYLSIIFMVFASCALAFGLCSVSKEFVPIFFGDGYDLVSTFIICLFPYVIFVCWSNVLKTQVLLPRGHDGYLVISLIIGAVVNLVLNIIFIPIWGAIGAAIATSIAEFTIAAFETIFARKIFKYKQYIVQCIPFLVFGFIMLLSIIFIDFNHNLLTLITKIGLGAVVYLVLSFIYIKWKHKSIWNLLFNRKKLNYNEKNE